MHGTDYDLHISVTRQDADLFRDIKAFNPACTLKVVQNKGYDVAPFIEVLNSVHLGNYDYIVKLHTKRDMPVGVLINRFDMGQTRWRDYALSFLSTPAHFKKCLKAFAQDEKLGMCGHHRLIFKNDPSCDTLFHEAETFLLHMGLHKKHKAFYVAGTMFMARAHLMQPFKDLCLSIDDFATPDRGHDNASLAHVIERALGRSVSAQGYVLKDCFSTRAEWWKSISSILFRRVYYNIYRRKRTKSGRLLIKLVKIPVWFFK